MKILSLILFCLLPLAATAVVWPTNTIVKTYAGGVSGSILSIPMTASVKAEVVATPDAFLSPSGNIFMVRGQFVKPPVFTDADKLTNWSNVILVYVSNTFFRSDVQWADGVGKVMANWSGDWSTLTLEGTGAVIGLDVVLDRSTLALVSVSTNENTMDAPIKTNDFLGITKWNGKNVSEWPETVQITGVSIDLNRKMVTIKGGLERVGRWNEADMGKCVNGEACFIFPRTQTAGMFDFLGCNQRDKTMGNLWPPENFLGEIPKSGDSVGFYIQTIQRNSGHAKMRERSNVIWTIWP